MKKPLLFLSCLLMLSITSIAQTFVPKAGLALSKFQVSSGSGDVKYLPGLTAGVAFNFPVSEIISIQPELYYAHKGAKSKSSQDFTFDTYQYHLAVDGTVAVDYIEMPVLVRLVSGTKTKFFIEGGPSLGCGIGGKTKIKFDYQIIENGTIIEQQHLSGTGGIKFEDPSDETPDESVDAYFGSRFDFGFQFGTGLILKDKYIIDLRYVLGLTKHADEIRNRSIMLTLGIPFPLNKKQ